MPGCTSVSPSVQGAGKELGGALCVKPTSPNTQKRLKQYVPMGLGCSFIFLDVLLKKISGWWTSLSSLVVNTPGLQCRGTDLILGGGTKIPHVSQDGQKVIKKIIKMVIGILRIASNWPRRREEGRGPGRASEAQGGRRTGSTPSPE